MDPDRQAVECLSMVSATENQPKKPQELFALKDRHARLDLPATPPKYNNKSQKSGAGTEPGSSA